MTATKHKKPARRMTPAWGEIAAALGLSTADAVARELEAAYLLGRKRGHSEGFADRKKQAKAVRP